MLRPLSTPTGCCNRGRLKGEQVETRRSQVFVGASAVHPRIVPLRSRGDKWSQERTSDQPKEKGEGADASDAAARLGRRG